MLGSAGLDSTVSFLRVHIRLLLAMTGYRAALAAMAPKVASVMVSVIASYMGKR